MHPFNVNVRIADNGDLILTAGNETRREIAETLRDCGFWTTLAKALEPYFANGEFEPFNAGDANPFVGLTDAPCIAESMDIDEDGKREIDGRFWYYADYMVRCPLEELARYGRTRFQLAR